MGIQVALYESHMRGQVLDLFSLEYGYDRNAFEKTFLSFYEHQFQRDSAFRVVALDGDRVVGFQSFFLWPYVYQTPLRTFQSGNSLVHPEYRGRGIFRKLLDFIHERAVESDVSFLVGFPVVASFGSFIRNGWVNVLDLRWYAKPLSPFFFLHRFRDEFGRGFGVRDDTILEIEKDCFRLATSPEFLEWRESFASTTRHSYEFKDGEHRARFELKFSRRGRWLREATIGNVVTTSEEGGYLMRAFVALTRELRRERSLAFVSIVINEDAPVSLGATLKATGFRRLEKKIHFVVKRIASDLPIEDPKRWILYRSDIDTW